MKETLKDLVAGVGVITVILLVVCKCMPWVGRWLLRDPHADAFEAGLCAFLAVLGSFAAGCIVLVVGASVRGRA